MKNKYYSGETGKEYDDQFEDHLLGFKIQADYFKPFINHKDIVLDFGCGRGEILKQINCKERHGVEINEWSREKAEKILDQVYGDLKFAPENHFDKVISNHAIEHTLDPYQYLSELKKKLKESGKLIIMLPLDDWRSKQQNHYNPDDIHQHLFAWTPQTIGNLLKTTGFKNIKVKIIKEAWSPKLFFLLKVRFFSDITQRVIAILKKRYQLFITANK